MALSEVLYSGKKWSGMLVSFLAVGSMISGCEMFQRLLNSVGFPKMVPLFQHILDPFDAVEPHQLDGAGAVGELGGKAFGALFPQNLVARDVALEQHVVAFCLDVADFIDGGFVHMAEGEVVE